MLQFLYPIGLLAAIGIIVPVVIHLWNIKSGKTLKVGSISLLGTAFNQRSSHLKIADWPLLLLRCLLILLIGLLLAGPLYRARKQVTQQPGWILLEKQEFAHAWKSYGTEMDSLLKNGYEIRDLHPGFARMELKDTALRYSRPASPPLSYFSYIRQLNTEIQPGKKVYLYTSNQLNRLEGRLPATTVDLKWRFLPVNPAVSVDAATIPAIDTSKLMVMIYSDSPAPDAAYLKAAIYAIADFTNRKISIKDIQSLDQVTKEATLVFWLSDKVPAIRQLQQLPKGISFFNYAGKKTERLSSVIHYEQGSATREIPLYQRNSFTGAAHQAIWTDGRGTPLLTLDTISTTTIRHYQFYSRFNQSWTDLVWSNGLVDALLPVVLPNEEDEPGFSRNTASTRVINTVPVLERGTSKANNVLKFDEQQPLSGLVWWLIMAVFFIERWITFRKTGDKI